MHHAIFLDRDGVLIENRPSYVRSWAEVRVYPQALAALARVRTSPYKFVIVTNQSAVGRGIISLAQAHLINDRLLSAIRQSGGRIDGIFMCPHAPQDHCECRKPKPGMFYQAAQKLQIDLSQSIMIGDALTDLLASRAAGIEKSFLVQTGRGAAQAKQPLPDNMKPFQIFNDLSEALRAIIPELS